MKQLFSGISFTTVSSDAGQSYGAITRYIIPEIISAFIVYSFPVLFDSYCMAQVGNTAAYATLGATNNIMYFVTKMAESFSIAAVITIGSRNGKGEYEDAGVVFTQTLWLASGIGILFSLVLYYAAEYLYAWYGVPHEMCLLGVPYLKMRAISVFCMFGYLAAVGFLRAVKNTFAPMVISVAGTVLFVLCDYALIFGVFGMPRMELYGSAVASVVQYGVMVVALLLYIFCSRAYTQYRLRLFRTGFSRAYAQKLLWLSAPVMLDKATMAWSYIWLCKMITPLGTCAVASYCVVKDIARFAFLPAMAGAQVITFLVSNDRANGDWHAILANCKKVCIVAAIAVGAIVSVLIYNPRAAIHLFDTRGEFTALAVQTLPVVGILVLCDLVQLVLSGALRGAGNVRTVMQTRVAVFLGYFVPCSYMLAQLPLTESLKFILVYSSFYAGNALLAIVYLNRLRGNEWKMLSLKGSE